MDAVFFYSGQPLLAGARAEHPHVLFDEGLELRMGGEVFLHGIDLVRRHVLGDVAPVLPALQVVVRAMGALSQDAELTLLQALDVRDLLKQIFGFWCGVHSHSIS